MGRNQQSKDDGYAGNKGNKLYASGGKGGGGNKKTVDAATALGLGPGVPQQNTMRLGLAGLGMVQQTPLDSRFGSVGTNTVSGLGGLNKSLQSANSGNDLLQLAALLGGSQQQSVTFQPAQLLQVRQALAQQRATRVAAHQEEIQKRIEAEGTTRAAELVKIEKEKQKQKSAQDTNATKPDDDDTTSWGSANGRSQGARKRNAIAEANAEKAKVEKERDELREALDILEAHLGTGTRPYDAEDGTRLSRVK